MSEKEILKPNEASGADKCVNEMIKSGFSGIVHTAVQIFNYFFSNRCFPVTRVSLIAYVDGLAQYCSNSIANALELLQSCTNLSM